MNTAEERAERRDALRNAAKECKAERADEDFAATHEGKSFDEFYGTNKNGKNAYGKCVSTKAREHKEAEDEQDADEATEFKNAAKECAAEGERKQELVRQVRVPEGSRPQRDGEDEPPTVV